jgi:cobalt-zinc-cadmium resistance protein CzcA
MHHTGIPANLLSLGAIDFGIIVDGAVVMMECILRHYEEGGAKPLKQRDVRNAAHEVTRPIFFGMAIIITAYLPLFMFERIEYKLFSPMAWAIGFALFGALLVCLTVIPGLAYESFRKPRPIFHNKLLDRVREAYVKVMDRVIVGHPAVTTSAFVFAILAVGLLGHTIGRDFLPYLDEGSIWLQVQLPAGISLDKASEMAGSVRKAAMEFKEVSNIVTQLGRNDDGTDPLDAVAHRSVGHAAPLRRVDERDVALEAGAHRQDGRALRAASGRRRGIHATHDRRRARQAGGRAQRPRREDLWQRLRRIAPHRRWNRRRAEGRGGRA